VDRLDALPEPASLSDCELKLERGDQEVVPAPAQSLEVRRGDRTEVDRVRVVHRRRNFRYPFDARTEERPTPPPGNSSIASEHGLNERVDEQLTEPLRTRCIGNHIEIAWRDVDTADGKRAATRQPPVDSVDTFEKPHQRLVPRRNTRRRLAQNRPSVTNEVPPRNVKPPGVLKKRPDERLAIPDEAERGRGLAKLRLDRGEEELPATALDIHS
jgi:hypothetical protein